QVRPQCQATEVQPHHHRQEKLCQPCRGWTLPRLGIFRNLSEPRVMLQVAGWIEAFSSLRETADVVSLSHGA
ncbi:hypothetical protein LEMLEM_LOCUS17492, partial [Lemmus lemmus]